MRLTHEDTSSIIAALRVAGEQYTRDAATSGETPRIADQFKQQAEYCRYMADCIEQHEGDVTLPQCW